MKPTKQQLLEAACKFCRLRGLTVSPDAHGMLAELLPTFTSLELYDFVRKSTSPECWNIHSELDRTNPNVNVTIQLNGFVDPMDCALALCWVINDEHECEVQRYSNAMNFLCQAIECGIVINRFEIEEVADRSVRERLEWDKDYVVGSDCLKTRKTLDPGSVALAFELAGVPAPRNLESWRKPSGVDVPEKATILSDPDFGTATVHYHDGLFALVSSADRMQVKLVHLQHIESAATEELKGFIKALKKNDYKTKKERVEEDGAALAAKWLD